MENAGMQRLSKSLGLQGFACKDRQSKRMTARLVWAPWVLRARRETHHSDVRDGGRCASEGRHHAGENKLTFLARPSVVTQPAMQECVRLNTPAGHSHVLPQTRMSCF
eukprot:472238-Pelagomonas_calceolata.AAC.8